MDDLPELHADRLRAFLAVAREGGFSRAARALGRTQSSLSQAVRALELELNEPLFVRDAREVQLTEAGEILRVHAERAFGELVRAREALLSLRKLTRGTLRVGTSDTLATYALPPVFAAFRARYPDVELRLDNRPSVAVAQRVFARELDLGVISLPFPDALRIDGQPAADCVRSEELGPQAEVLICPPGHRYAARRSLELLALASEPLVLLDRTTAGRALLDARLEALAIKPQVVMEMSSVEVLKRLVELGFGLSVIPALAAERECAQGTLRAIALRGLVPRQIGLVTPTVGPLSHASRAFVEVLREVLGQMKKGSTAQPRARINARR
jgi:DNA-binding transcriptional LysR family regulator